MASKEEGEARSLYLEIGPLRARVLSGGPSTVHPYHATRVRTPRTAARRARNPMPATRKGARPKAVIMAETCATVNAAHGPKNQPRAPEKSPVAEGTRICGGERMIL